MIERWGPQAVMPLNYAGPHGMLAGDSMSLRFFHRLGATQLYRRSAVRRGAQRGLGRHLRRRARHARPSSPSTPSSTSSGATTPRSPTCIWCARPPSAKRKGGRLVVVDPLRTKIAEQADLHLAPRPGTDVLLAWSLAVELERIGAHDHAFIDAARARLR